MHYIQLSFNINRSRALHPQHSWLIVAIMEEKKKREKERGKGRDNRGRANEET